jgi:hypothetical protein
VHPRLPRVCSRRAHQQPEKGKNGINQLGTLNFHTLEKLKCSAEKPYKNKVFPLIHFEEI